MEYKDNEFGYQNREPVMPSVSDQGPAFTAPHYTYGQQSYSYGPSAETPVKADPQYASTYRPQPSAFAAENSVAEAAPAMAEAMDTEPVQAETLDPAPAAATVAAAPEMAGTMAEAAPEMAETAAEVAPKMAETAAEVAPEMAQASAKSVAEASPAMTEAATETTAKPYTETMHPEEPEAMAQQNPPQYDFSSQWQYTYTGNAARAAENEPKAWQSGSWQQEDPKKARAARKKEKKQAGYVTRRGFVLGMICCMLATSGLTIGGLGIAGAFDKPEPVVIQEQPQSQASAQTPADTAESNGSENNVSSANYNLAQATGAQLSVQEIVAKNENAVVEIQTESVATDSWLQNYVTQGAGSGIIMDERGYILTCNHVIEGANTITVRLKNGTEYDATVIGADSLTDVAVIKIEGSGFQAATYGDSEALSIGDLVVAIGNPLGTLGGSASQGIISSLDRELNVDGKMMTLLQTDASINPGNSGGGLFNSSGQLIGVVVAKSSGSDIEGLGFAIPSNTAKAIAEELIANGKVSGRALIGVNILDLTNANDAMQYGVKNTGIYVYDVTGIEAQKAGFQSGDMLYYFDDTRIDSEATLRACLAAHKPGDTVKITVIRNNETVELTTTLIEQE